METLKRYIIDFYKTHDKHTCLNFYDVMKALNMSKNELDTFLRALLHDGFIHSVQDADNVAYLFRLNQ